MKVVLTWFQKIISADANKRTKALFNAEGSATPKEIETNFEAFSTANKGLKKLIAEAGLKIPPYLVVSCSLAFGIMALFGTLPVLSIYFIPLAVLAAAWIPISYLNSLAEKRAASFLADYSPVLLASASSMKAGLTAYMALERAAKLLGPTSLVRQEVEALLANISNGIPKEEAISKLGANIRLPELELFRAAMQLVTSHGGKFVPTLHRLAMVSRERAALIGAAQVSTASMRMTANVLLLISPVLLLMVSFRTKDFWSVMLHHPVSSVCASLGATVIMGCYFALRKMSNFKP